MGRKKKASEPPPEQSAWRLAGFVGLLTFLLYLPSLWSGFVYDAEAQIQTDGYIHDRSHFAEVLTLRVMSRDVLDNNRPVQLLSLMTDSLFWGRNPLGYHLTDNLLHGVNTALVFLLIVMALRDAGVWRREPVLLGAAFFGAMLFGFHPVNVEPVAEVSSREDVLVTFFVLIGLFCTARYAREGKWWLLGGSLAACFLAVGTKESGVVAPVMMAAYWLLFRRGDNWRPWAATIAAMGVVVAAFIAARFLLQPADSVVFIRPPGQLGGSLGMTLQIQPRIWAFLISSLFWPLHLSADYGPANLTWLNGPMTNLILGAPGAVQWLLGWSGLILVAFVAMQGLLGWKSRVAAFGALVFWMGLAPVSNLLPMYRPLADRYMYLPMVGMALMVAGGLSLIPAKRSLSQVVPVVCAMILLALAILTYRREDVFSNSLKLWTDTRTKSPSSGTAANNFGYALLRAGRYSDALTAYDYSLSLKEGDKADSLSGAAIAFEKLGQKLRAEDTLNRAIAVNPMYAHPEKLLKSMMTTPEDAAVLEGILKRMPAQP